MVENARSRHLSVLNYVCLTLALLVTLVPFFWVFLGAFKSNEEILNDPGAWFPRRPTFANFITLFQEYNFFQFGANSVIVAAAVVLGNMILCSMVGYALAKIQFRGAKIIFAAVLAELMIPFVALFVPQFVVTARLGLIDSLAGMIVPMIVLPLGIFIVRQFAYSIPDELLDAARIDGAGEFRVFAQVFLPLASPAIATVAILTFLGNWNGFIWPLVVAQSQRNYTLPVGLAIASQAENTTNYGVLLAGSVVVLLPVLILFVFLQRYFIQGIAATGVK